MVASAGISHGFTASLQNIPACQSYQDALRPGIGVGDGAGFSPHPHGAVPMSSQEAGSAGDIANAGEGDVAEMRVSVCILCHSFTNRNLLSAASAGQFLELRKLSANAETLGRPDCHKKLGLLHVI